MNYLRKLYGWIILVLPVFAVGQFPYSESFMNSAAPGMVVAGAARLTAATGADPDGAGYLRLTENTVSSVGYAYCQQAFPSSYGLTVSFEFFMWKSDATGYNQADGISFFLFDAAVNSFRPGGAGGSLGYANYYTTPGMAKGYLGVSIDGFGNFSSATDGNKSGGPGRRQGAIAIRGPGDGATSGDYVYQTGVIASDAAYTAGFLGFTQRYPLSTSANYRKLEISLAPGSSLGAAGYTLTVKMIKGGATPTSIILINNLDYPYNAPANLKFGLAGSTGSLYNFQEIRNITVSTTNTNTLQAPFLAADNATICANHAVPIDITANDSSLNIGGKLIKSTIDLDPQVPGQQKSFTDIGKGDFIVDTAGILIFTPNTNFAGVATVSYLVTDNYGKVAALPATATITVGSSPAPMLSLGTPPPVCFPATINITNPLYRLTSTTGATYDYFRTSTDAGNNTNNIDLIANAINTAGTYFVRATVSGCATIAPILVQISKPPTVANAGPDQNFCSSTGNPAITLLANNPGVGTGKWTQVSGPSMVNVNFLNASTSPLIGLAQGVYQYRWTISTDACPVSADDIIISVGVAANAGAPQNLCNSSTLTLAGSSPGPGTGTWTKTSGPTVSFGNVNDPGTSVTGLTPGNNYAFLWKITNGGCVNSHTVTISNLLNTIANAGADQTISAPATTLNGNAAGSGNSGYWTLVSAPGGSSPVILQPANQGSGINGLTIDGNYLFRWTVSNGGCNNSDDTKISVLGVLPVRLVSFIGARSGDEVKLTWQTAHEENNERFDIERSTDGFSFLTIGSRAGRGGNDNLQDYSYNDDIRSIHSESVFYRLRQVDQDGHTSLSPVVHVLITNAWSVVFSANPFKANAALKVSSSATGVAFLTVYDMNGKRIHNRSIRVSEGDNLIPMPELDGVIPGVYVIIFDGMKHSWAQRVLKVAEGF